jgi:sarcosine oxidase subunit gamma
MKEGDVARSLIGHMTAIIILRSGGVDVMVFRSMAATLVHEFERVMRSVHAQRSL